MGEHPSIEEVADGLALWQEHKPRTLDDWKEIARRFSEEADGLRSQLEDREQRLRDCRDAHARAKRTIRPDAIHPDVLRSHYLAEVVCDHDRKMDQPRCSCSLVNLGWHASVGAAVDAWVAHVVEQSRGTRFFETLAALRSGRETGVE